jgi:hypothetical protein
MTALTEEGEITKHPSETRTKLRRNWDVGLQNVREGISVTLFWMSHFYFSSTRRSSVLNLKIYSKTIVLLFLRRRVVKQNRTGVWCKKNDWSLRDSSSRKSYGVPGFFKINNLDWTEFFLWNIRPQVILFYTGLHLQDLPQVWGKNRGMSKMPASFQAYCQSLIDWFTEFDSAFGFHRRIDRQSCLAEHGTLWGNFWPLKTSVDQSA